MTEYIIDSKESADDFLAYIKEMPSVVPRIDEGMIFFDGDKFEVVPKFNYLLSKFKGEENVKKDRQIHREIRQDDNSDMPDGGISIRSDFDDNISEIDSLIFGKDSTESIVAIESVGEEIHIFKADGSIEKRENEYWILASRPIGRDSERLEGSLFYKYKKTFTDEELFKKARGIMYAKRTPMYQIYDPVEAYMTMNGLTFFKGLKVQDVSVLSFDIESTGVAHNENSKVLLISNTFRDREGKISRKLFALDDYGEDDVLMISAWASWVRETDPSIMIGHNIFGFDLPYLTYCYNRNLEGLDIKLGKDGSEIKYGKKPKKFRKDGSQSYDFHEAKIFGRQIIDTWMLSIKADFARKYESYGLKQIIKQEGLEKEDRTKFDFSEIFPNEIWQKFQDGDVEMWAEFKKYCIEDSDDSLKLYDLMIPQYFYYMQSLPMPFQTMNITATGRQINGLLVRSYLQKGHSIPQANEKEQYGGGISFGVPGVYKNVAKFDIKSMYPSIMLQYEVFDEEKDPGGNFLTMVRYFTKERFANKKKFKETGDRYYDDMQAAGKITVNSAYGLLGTPGLNFNSMKLADFVTKTGRAIIEKSIIWATGKGSDHWIEEANRKRK